MNGLAKYRFWKVWNSVAVRAGFEPGANIRSWILSPEQEPKYLDACNEPLKTVATIILDAGLRPDECFRLRWENVRFVDAKRAVLVVPGTKTVAAARPVPMTPRLRGIIESRWTNAGKP